MNKNSIKKNGPVWALSVVTFIASAMICVGRANAATLSFSLAPLDSGDGIVLVRVLDDLSLAPVSGSLISITDSGSQTLEQVTDASGTFTFQGLATGLKSLSVTEKNHASVSVLGFKSNQITIFLSALPTGDHQVIASGTSAGWETLADPNLLYAGVVIRSLSAFDLVTFDMDSLISPLMDTIDVFGSHEVPSNLLAPSQQVNTGFFPITVAKPNYRLPLQAQSETHLVHLQGKVPVSDVMSIVQGEGSPGIEIMNKLTMSRLGISSAFTPGSDLTKNVQTTISLAPKTQIQALPPPFAADVLTAAFTDMNGDRLILVPTDAKLAVKAAQSSTVPMVTVAAPTQSFGKNQNVLTIARNATENRLTGIVNENPGAKLSPGAYLKVEKISDQALPNTITVEAPASGLGGMIFEATDSSRSANPYAVWYVYSLPAAGKATFETGLLSQQKSGKLKAMTAVQFEFTSFNPDQIDGTTLMRGIKRFARATGKLK